MILALTHAQQSNDALASLAALLFFLLVFVFVVILPLAATWQIFVKAGEPGWAAIVPFYNMVVFLKIIDRPIWWIALLIIPVVNFIVPFFLLYELARVFGKGIGFANITKVAIFEPLCILASADRLAAIPIPTPAPPRREEAGHALFVRHRAG
ncbi:MAG: hypothetical protein EI684_12170 [Candidatus Viridilinea halotolerans]|uniref:Signal peptidase I n=1 Tax=Candidatus Viridilinea halotolerans TaxID=2491704 RepID=A0A426TYE8_9CHLR|nr:MAG: hypothetical protein EI684_12170 [Candidatus Viridilinea halotolerans]